MSRSLAAALLSIVALAVLSAFAAGPASAASQAKAATAPYTVASDNNIVVSKTDPNPEFYTYATNHTTSSATCNIHVQGSATWPIDGWSGDFSINPGQTYTIGWGGPFPTGKRATMTVDLYCNGGTSPVASIVSKVTLTDHVG